MYGQRSMNKYLDKNILTVKEKPYVNRKNHTSEKFYPGSWTYLGGTEVGILAHIARDKFKLWSRQEKLKMAQ
jgi:hypothetical protein